MTRRRPTAQALVALAVLAPLAAASCEVAECATPNYTRAECRVIAENELARLSTAAGVEIRFQPPDATSDDTWIAAGLLRETTAEGIVARVAGPGAFAISVRREPFGPDRVSLRLDNVDPAATVRVGPAGAEVEVPPPDPPATSRMIAIDLPDDEVRFIRGDVACRAGMRLAITADIQTNPTQFQRIVEHLADEARQSAAIGEPLMGLLIAGDISENTRTEELDLVHEILARLPVPVAVTAGNHDVYRPARPYFNTSFGPGNHTFRVCDTKVVMLDTGSGGLATSVQARLPELLDREGARHLIVGMHHPVYPGVTGGGWSREDQAAFVLAELAIADADLVFAGHVHALHEFADIPVGDHSVREIIAGTAGALQGLGSPRYGYVRLTIGVDRLDACFVEVPPAGYEGPIGEPLEGLPYCPEGE
jgi:hypothetical protein